MNLHSDLARRLVAAFLVPFGIATAAPRAEEPPPSTVVAFAHDTGFVANSGSTPAVVASFVVSVEGASWLRLFFETVELAGEEDRGTASKLRIVSALDGAEQVLSARTAREWSRTSAYFNGDTLLVEVIAEPGTGQNRVALAEVVAGLPPPIAFTQCGPRDDRVLSDDPRVARLLPAGCTAWLFDDCAHCFLTAGHCIGTNMVAEFAVPPSTSIGTIVHPPPGDQYAYDPLSIQSQSSGVGNDWGLFGCFDNALTGLSPFEKQQAAYVLAPEPELVPAWTIRVTGYGTDFSPPSENYVQQTDSGSWLGATATVLTYQADTEGGNSGSAIEWVEGGVALGIHTHGGCNVTLSEGNRGTPLTNPGLQAALASPRGVCAEACGPSVATYCVPKANSQGCLPRITFGGIPSASGGAGSFLIGASDVIETRPGLLVYGPSAEVTPFLGGMWCVGGSVTRTALQLASGDGGPLDCSGQYGYDMGARIAAGLDPLLVPGATVCVQWWMRDPVSQPYPVGLSDALAFTIGP